MKVKKKKEQQAIDLQARYRVLHTVPLPERFRNRDEREGQPGFADGSNYASVSYLMGTQKITHQEAIKLYHEAIKREQTAREVREFWGEVISNWNAHTEKVKDDGGQ